MKKAVILNLLLLFSFLGFAQNYTPKIDTNMWVTNGPIYSIVENRGVVFLGGDYSMIGPATGGGGQISLSTGELKKGLLHVNGQVLACVSDNSGGWYIGGSFSKIGGKICRNIAHILPDNTLDTLWRPRLNGWVKSIAVYDTNVYVGGDFDSVDNDSRKKLVCIGSNSGKLNSWNPNPDLFIEVLSVYGDKLFVGGSFTTIADSLRNNLASFDLTTHQLTRWNVGHLEGRVLSVVCNEGLVYVGGEINRINGQIRRGLFVLDSLNGALLNLNFDCDGSVYALQVKDSILYVGGGFSIIGGENRNSIAAVNKKTTNATSWNPQLARNSFISTLVLGDSTIFIGGNFNKVNNEFRLNFAELKLNSGLPTSLVSHCFSDRNFSFGSIYDIAFNGQSLFLGGQVNSIAGQQRQGLALIDINTDRILNRKYNVNGAVKCLRIEKDNLFVGGGFTSINDSSRLSLAKIKLSNNEISNWSPVISGSVNTLEVYEDKLYFGGLFSINNFPSIQNLAAVDTSFGVNFTYLPAPNSEVIHIKEYYHKLLVSGMYSNIGNQPFQLLSYLDLKNGTVSSWSHNINGFVYDSKIRDSSLFLVGSFSQINNRTRNGIAVLNSNTYRLLNYNSNLVYGFGGMANILKSILLDKNYNYVGGSNISFNGKSTGFLRIDANSGVPDIFESNYSLVNNMFFSEDMIYFAGDPTFMTANDNYCSFGRIKIEPCYSPEKPKIYSSSLSLRLCKGSSITLEAPEGYGYLWSNGSKERVINVNQSGSYSVSVIHRECTSQVSDPFIISLLDTSNVTIFESVCRGQAYQFGNQSINTAGTYRRVLINSLGCDSVVVLNLSLRDTASTSISEFICRGQAYQFGNQSINTAGTYRRVLINSLGCDSAIVLSLSLRDTASTSISESVCRGQAYQFGNQSINTAGTYRRVLINSLGCDSAVVLNLSLRDTASTSISESVCRGQTYQFGTQTLGTAGSYRRVLTNALGCDSAVILNLSIRDTSSTSISESVCRGQTYQFGTQTLGTAGTYRRVLTNALGCDSAVVLNLSLRDTSTTSITEVICKGRFYQFGNQSLNTAGTYRRVLTNSLGCDSSIVLNLTVRDTLGTITQSICKGQSFVFGNQTLTASGTYRRTLPNSIGCDSTVILSLNVRDTSFSETSVVACQGDVIPFGSGNIIASGSYIRRVTNAIGCDSSIRLVALFKPYPSTNTVVGQNGARAVARGANLVHLWQRIGGGIISTTDSLTAINGGNFRLIIADTAFGVICADTSNPFVILSSGPNLSNVTWSAYPNPANDFVTLEGVPEEAEIQLISSIGINYPLIREAAERVSLRGVPAGVYLLEIRTDTHLKRLRLTVQR